MTKERRYQLRKQAKGICVICTRVRLTSTRCAIHAVKQEEYGRRYDVKRPCGWERSKTRKEVQP